MKSKNFIIGIGIVAVIVTIWSFAAIRSAQAPSGSLDKMDKAGFIYDRAKELMETGDSEKAVNNYTAIIKQFPDSEYTEKSLRDLASYYSQKGDYSKSSYYNKRLLKSFPGIKDASEVQTKVDNINVEMVKSPQTTADSFEYVVQKGDSLYALAKKYNTTIGLIKQANHLSSDVIRLGQKLKITVAKFNIFVDKSKNILILNKDGEPFKTYTVSTGKNNSTPVGTFTIVDKMVTPPWTKPGVGTIMPDDPRYELGKRWMAISCQGYGIHGTNDENSIGGQVTAGCVRMHNNDVIELYDLVPVGTPVEIIDGTASGEKAADNAAKK
ncbi:MAG TPA: L,D-transpeptidase family protein [Candidatus Omnitrophota bacterium]|nr:L,D-transpeptidase family protein [Candidatus Omnitrophota bacterium]HPS20064.1 L,D-transpeptidase family protein [Candidatus Omnitrophota bacterium]